MNRSFVFFALICFVVFTWVACSKSGNNPPADPCAGVAISVTATVVNATSGQSNGSITATGAGGSGFTYSLNGGAFQSSGTFSNLAAGTYTVAAKTTAGCQGSAQFTVGTTNVCAGVTINLSATTTNAVPCGGPQGSLTATATGSTGFTFSINGGNFQASNSFANLAAGAYTVTARDVNGCTQTANATVNAVAAGPLFSAVRTIVQASCAISGCHNASAAGGVNFTTDCSIVSNGPRIKFRAVDQAGTANQMPQPPNPALSASQRQAIDNWITAGGRFDN